VILVDTAARSSPRSTGGISASSKPGTSDINPDNNAGAQLLSTTTSANTKDLVSGL